MLLLLMNIFRVVIFLFAVVCGRDSVAVVSEGCADDSSGISMGSNSVAVVAGCGDDSSGISMGFDFRKEGVNCALIEGVNCAS